MVFECFRALEELESDVEKRGPELHRKAKEAAYLQSKSKEYRKNIHLYEVIHRAEDVCCSTSLTCCVFPLSFHANKKYSNFLLFSWSSPNVVLIPVSITKH